MKIISKNKCSGCSACYSICPSDAISMTRDEEGFLYPIIDEKKCTNCGLCRKVCPVLNKYIKKNQSSSPKCFAGWNKNELIRKNSSSGGLFSVIAEYVFSKSGFVCGAGFDEDNKLRHIVISDEKDLPKLRGSKYMQSEIGNILLEVKDLLDKDKIVLFVGTPCQVAGLNSFLQKNYEKLITVDVVCHGTPSPKVFNEYVKDIENSTKKNINKIEFRNKITGWKTFSFVLSDKECNVIHKEVIHQDVFGKGFLNNLYLKPLCTSCPFATIPRQSDITLGDFWAIWEHKKELDDDNGTSLILINSTKGESILNEIKNKIIIEEAPLRVAHRGNLVLSMPCDKHPNREEFFEEFSKDDGNVRELILKHLNDRNDKIKNSVGILNMRLPSRNFGATLQAFALRKSIEKFGYDAKIINYVAEIPESKEEKLCALGFYKFRERFIKMTHVCKTNEDLIKLNNQFDSFVVGSDQVWNYNYLSSMFKEDIGKYFLNFAISSKNIISYAPSFAENHWKGTSKEIKQVKNALCNFSSISVREKDGINICKEVFDVDATCVLDPTLLLNEKDYQEIIDDEIIEKYEGKYVAYFTLDEKLEGEIEGNSSVDNVVKKMGCNIVNIRGTKKDIFDEKKFVYNFVPDWLNYIKNSELIITDSYHCVIFAIIFKKQFIAIARDYAGNSRFKSLLSILNISNRLLKNINEIENLNVHDGLIDYDAVYKILDIEKEKSLKFLKNSLKKSKTNEEKINLLEKELILIKLKQIEKQYQKINSELEKQEIDLMYANLQLEYHNLQNINNQIQSEYHNLQNINNQIQLEFDWLKNTVAVRYANRVKKILKKIGLMKS
ncbi:MAG: polysaccharide pyruvyl transferase family protein [Candidatus Moraniibacteriota bacterium]